MLNRLWIFMLLVAVTASVRAQLRLPAPQVPALPVPVLPAQALSRTLDQTNNSTDRLSGVRHLAIARLIHASHHLVEADPNGEPIVRGDILALSPSDAALDSARSHGYVVAREQPLATADLRVFVLQAPANLSTRRALDALRAADPIGVYDYNHIYTGAGRNGDPPAASTRGPAIAGASTLAASTVQRPHIRIGLLDTGIASSHPIFRDSVVHTWGCSNKPVPGLHGTAVASLLLTRATADLYAADVYCGLPTGGAVDAIIAALAWLTSERVPVINVSLVGPKNALLEQTVAALIDRGYLIVAAVGNDGPAAPPLYPAAYPNVVGVTGVDSQRRVLLEAGRGPQVMFAALGAGIRGANLEQALADVRGTSFATPAVAGLLAEMLSSPDKVQADAAIDSLAKRAIDLGPPGRDLTYGFGFVGTETP